MAATVTQTVSQIDAAKAQAFGAKMIDVVNKGSLALMTSIGHQTGLFETMKDMPPADSARIASASGLNERYVREWLGAMVTGGIVEYDAAARTYWLPPEHAASLTPEAGPRNVALVAQMIPLLASVEQNVVDSFRNGGGVHYHCYPRFHSLMAESSAAQFDSTLVSHVLPLIPGMVDRLREGAAVADVGCGAGHAVNVMARAFPKSSFTGYDFSEEAIETARSQAVRWGVKNAQFHVKDVSELDVRSGYDLITAFDAIHDQARPARVLEGIAAALKPEGKFLMVDIHASSHVGDNVGHPLSPFLYTVSCMHCMTVSLALDGAGLGAVWGEQTARRMLREAGFHRVEMHRLDDDILNAYYIAAR